LIANARLALKEKEPKKKTGAIGNSYNSIQDAPQTNPIISISLRDAKKIQEYLVFYGNGRQVAMSNGK